MGNSKDAAIKLVAARLLASLEGQIPSQRTLAREFNLSESTMKRYFRTHYGTTINVFYLGNKMELAKRLLLETDMTVADTAHRVGYEKVSAFIVMFKKHYNYTPGYMRINKIQ